MELDLRSILALLRKRKWYVASMTVACLAIGAVVTVSATPIYQASATLFVGQRQITVERLSEGVAVSDLSARLLRSYAQIIESRSLAEQAIAQGHLKVASGQIQSGLSAQPIVDTQVIRVAYRSTSPAAAAQVANAVADAFVKQLGVLAEATPGQPAVTVSIIDRALPPGAPVSPIPARNMTLALILGLMAGAGLAYARDALDVTVKTREEVEQLGLPVTGIVPTLDTKGANVHLESDPQVAGGEAFRKLRTTLGFLSVDRPTKVLLVTSAMAGEGKTTIALNLAVAFAQSSLNTLLIEADLRRPSLHEVFGTDSSMRGLTTAIVGRVEADDSHQATRIPNLSVMTAGAIPPNPVELLDSEQMTDLLEKLRTQFDQIIIDTPPLIPVADPAALASRADGVLIVARAGKTHGKRLREAVEVIERSNGRFIGVLLNFLRAQDAPYEYHYYYSYKATNYAAEPVPKAEIE